MNPPAADDEFSQAKKEFIKYSIEQLKAKNAAMTVEERQAQSDSIRPALTLEQYQ